MQIVKSNNNWKSRPSITHHCNLPVYNKKKLIGFFFNNKSKFCFVPENKPTNQEPCCCRFFFFLLLPLKLHRSLQKKGAPLGPFATYWVLTDCVHQCTSPCCVEQRRHRNPLSQPVPDLHPNLHPKSLPPSLSNWSVVVDLPYFDVSISFFLSFFSTNSCLAQRDQIVDMTIIDVYSNDLTIVPFF
jgi:hypothetical protein